MLNISTMAGTAATALQRLSEATLPASTEPSAPASTTPNVEASPSKPEFTLTNGVPDYAGLNSGRWADADPREIRAVRAHAAAEWAEVSHDRKMLAGFIVKALAMLAAAGLSASSAIVALATEKSTSGSKVDYLVLTLVAVWVVLAVVQFARTLTRISTAQKHQRLAAVWCAARGIE